MVPAGVQLLAQLAAPAERLVAAIFPHIRICCFEVSEQVADTLAAAADGGASALRREPGEKPHVDLSRLLCLQLAAAGLAASRVELLPGCTRCEPERFFSYRRDGQVSGRHLAVIAAG